MPRVLAVANQKGGVGKTTTAVSLAAALALSGRRTLLVDLDPQANATSGLGVSQFENERKHPLLDTTTTKDAFKACQQDGLCVLPSSPRLLRIEHEIARYVDGATRLRRWLDGVPGFDFVLIDCPPSLGPLTMNALNAASGVLIPIQCEYYAMEGLAKMVDAVEQARRVSKADLKVEGVLLTMFDPELELSREVAREVRSFLGDSVYRTTIPRDVSLSEATSYGQTAFVYSPRGAGALAYLELAKEVMENG